MLSPCLRDHVTPPRHVKVGPNPPPQRVPPLRIPSIVVLTPSDPTVPQRTVSRALSLPQEDTDRKSPLPCPFPWAGEDPRRKHCRIEDSVLKRGKTSTPFPSRCPDNLGSQVPKWCRLNVTSKSKRSLRFEESKRKSHLNQNDDISRKICLTHKKYVGKGR